MDFFYELKVDSGLEDFVYQQRHFNMYKPGKRFSEWRGDLPTGSIAFKRAQGLLDVFPQKGGQGRSAKV
eukprot:7480108-Lingulodinium_polyedra.AAC.1